MIGLVDGNNFFVSCERAFAPKLNGKPVAVLSNNDGCCIARSNEFKQLGIPMGTPYFQLKNLAGKYGLIFRSSNYALYGDISRRIINILYEFVPEVEQYSIDEAFIHPALPENADFFALGKVLRKTILQYTSIPCGVGFAATKTLAKMANHMAKKSPEGVFVMPQDNEEILQHTPIEDVWGVGRQLACKLNTLNINNARQLAASDIKFMRKKFSVTLAKTILELRGISCFAAELPENTPQSISCSRSFGVPVTELEQLTESIAFYCASAAGKLRKSQQTAAGACVYFTAYPEYGDRPLPGESFARTIIFPAPTDDTGLMNKAILPELAKIYRNNRRYKKSGIIFYGLEKASAYQPTLFMPENAQGSSQLYRTVDKINSHFGRNTLFNLAEGIKKPWQMQRNLLSKNYTGCWDQLLEVK